MFPASVSDRGRVLSVAGRKRREHGGASHALLDCFASACRINSIAFRKRYLNVSVVLSFSRAPLLQESLSSVAPSPAVPRPVSARYGWSSGCPGDHGPHGES